jgi:hypothetical protein
MDDLKIEPRDMWMRKKLLAEKEWYIYLDKYHVSKEFIDHGINSAKKDDYDYMYSFHSWQIPFCCKEVISNRDECKKLLLAIKEHVSKLMSKEFNVDFFEHKRRNGEISYFVLIRKKPKISKWDPYFRMHKEVNK